MQRPSWGVFLGVANFIILLFLLSEQYSHVLYGGRGGGGEEPGTLKTTPATVRTGTPTTTEPEEEEVKEESTRKPPQRHQQEEDWEEEYEEEEEERERERVECAVPRDTTDVKFISLSDLKLEPLEGLMRSPAWEAGEDIDVEDRKYLKFLPTLVDVDRIWKGKKKIMFDLGLQTFDSSVGWMRLNYPVTFDAIYGWEVEDGVFELPRAADIVESLNFKNQKEAQKFLNSIHYEIRKADIMDSEPDENGGGGGSRDIAKFVKEHSSIEDYVVFKMDIEGGEWELMPHLIEQGVLDYIDELFVEIHFAHERMGGFGWDMFDAHNLDEAREMMQDLRNRGVVAHYWP